jgi:hypothetical protein
MAWGNRPKNDRYAIIGAFAGMLVAGIVAIMFAYNAGSFVRYLIMATGLVVGWGLGRWLGSRP